MVNIDQKLGKPGKNIMVEFTLRDDYIKLGQVLKAVGFVETGVEAKNVIQEGRVRVNGSVDTRRGKKLIAGDVVTFGNKEIRIHGTSVAEN